VGCEHSDGRDRQVERPEHPALRVVVDVAEVLVLHDEERILATSLRKTVKLPGEIVGFWKFWTVGKLGILASSGMTLLQARTPRIITSSASRAMAARTSSRVYS
jgi:hypothetical protein